MHSIRLARPSPALHLRNPEATTFLPAGAQARPRLGLHFAPRRVDGQPARFTTQLHRDSACLMPLALGLSDADISAMIGDQQ